MTQNLPQIAPPSYVETVLTTMSANPFATQSLILLAVVGAFCYYLHKKK